MIKKILACVCIVSILGIGLIGCSPKDNVNKEEKLDKVTFILDWLPNTNHTGLYVALEKGYYEEEGIEIEIVQPSEGDALTLVAAGQGDFGVSFQEKVTYARTTKNPLPVKAVAAIIQENTSGFASPVDKNIVSPKDFEGKMYGGWGTDIESAFIKALMEKENADYNKLEVMDLVSTDFFTSVSNNVDFQWIFYGWDGVASEVRNFPINFIKLQDVDPTLDFYTPVIVAGEETIENKQDLIKRFLRATTKGYEYTIASPEEAVEDLLKHAPETNKEIAIESQKYLANEYKKGVDNWGEMRLEKWKIFGEWMYENELLETEFIPEEAFTNEFLPTK